MSELLALVADHGSPLYVYDEATLIDRCQALRSALERPRVRVLYAVKANANPHLLRIIAAQGLDFDAVSEGEVRCLLDLGIPPARISYNGNNVTAAEIATVADLGVAMILDSLSQLRVLGRLGRTSRVGVRVNTGVGGGHHGHVITGGVDSKFGMEPSDVPESLRIAADHGLKITTVHQHIGSGIRDAELLLQAVDGLLLVAAQFPDLEVVDFGGGFGVPYRPGEAALDLERFGAGWRERVAALEARLQRPIHVACEPGRFVVAECGTLLVTVTARKRGSRHVFVGVDSGFHHLLRPALYGAHHEIENLSNPRGEPQLVRVAGNICESGDLLAVDRWLPECREGDILALRTVGAYGYSMASTYNLRPRPAEVLVQRDGTARRIRRRETLEDLLRSAGALA